MQPKDYASYRFCCRKVTIPKLFTDERLFYYAMIILPLDSTTNCCLFAVNNSSS